MKVQIRNWKNVLINVYDFAIVSLFIIIFSIWKQVNVSLAITVLLVSLMFVYGLRNYKKHITFLIFLSTFFVFLLGAYFLNAYFGIQDGVVLFNSPIMNHIYLTFIIALCFLWLGYFLPNYFSFMPPIKLIQSKEFIDLKLTRKITQNLFLLSYIPYILIEIIRVIQVRNTNYTNLYLSDGLKMPYIVQLFAYMCPIFFYMYLATMPKKKNAIYMVVLYLVYSVITLLTGARIAFVTNVLTIFTYFILRNNYDGDEEIWISKKQLLSLVVVIPLLVLFLDLVGNLRFSNTAYRTKHTISIFDALVKQGVTGSVVGFAKYYEDILPKQIYSFGSVIESIKYNPISRYIFHAHPFTGQNVTRALHGNLFSHAISYFAIPYDYLHGRGLGSSYIAEAYHDFGYIGVALFSLLYGFILKQISRFNQLSIWGKVIALIIFSKIIIAPRSVADGFISIFLHSEVVLSFIILVILVKIFSKQLKNKSES